MSRIANTFKAATNRVANAGAALFGGTRIARVFSALFSNRYEAGMPSGPSRSFIPAFVRDARFDATPFTRWEMCRKIRYFERNLWIIPRLREVHTKYTVGPAGMPVIPASSDHEWNQRMQESYLEWCESPCLDSTLSMPQVHRLISGETHLDGEIFTLKTRRKAAGKQSIPAIQLIESHRVSSPGKEFAFPSEGKESQVDGIEIDAAGRPIGIWVRDGFDGAEWSYRPSDQVIHIFDPERAGMYRAVTPYHASLNTSHDLDDLEILEMQRARDNSSITNIWKTRNGELNPEQLRRLRFNGQGANAAPSTAQADELSRRLEQYRQVSGARTMAINSDEEWQQFANANPSAATQWYWRLKMAQISAAVNIPFLLVLPEIIESMQGTAVRAILDDAHLSFRAKFHVYAHAARDIYRFYADWARYNDPRCVDAPADWAKCHVIPPRAVNVDVGRNSAAMLAELSAGTTNYDDVYGANGSTAEVGLRKKARNVGMIKQIAAEESEAMGVEIKPEEIAGNLADIAAKLAQADNGTDEEATTKEKKAEALA